MADPQRQADYFALVSGRRRGLWAAMLRGLLWAASLPYRAVVAARRAYYRLAARRVDLPVVSVGNLTVGGTGKTPLVVLVVRRLAAMGHRPVIVSRGYKRQHGRTGDEAAALRRELPPMVKQIESSDRYAALCEVVRTEPHDVAVLDDGFQHLRLYRNLDIVAVDATRPFGYGHCLPRGLLREPVSALRRAGVVVITRSDQVDAVALADVERRVQRYLRPGATLLHASHRPTGLLLADGGTAPMETLRGRPCYAFCGLGNPEAFHRTLADLGAVEAATRDFADHHAYGPADIAAIVEAARAAEAEWIVTTTKDFAKVASDDLVGRWPDAAKVAAVEIEIVLDEGNEALDDVLRPLVGAAEHGDRSHEEP
ncbi:MAG: tetraacyldisaccharide 4'-kinase [Planctomycetes bacterium]|nr:tetraacyldisaccharide 4'-kinase [Planctomycetota bacterium]